MKTILMHKDMLRLLAVGLLIVCSGWGPLLVTETVAETESALAQRPGAVFAEVRYDAETMQLSLTFGNGRVYVYANVPEAVALDLQRVVNQGEYFAKHIRNHYVCERLDASHSLQVASN